MAKTYKTDSFSTTSLEQLDTGGNQFPDITDTLYANLGNVSSGTTENNSDGNTSLPEKESDIAPVDNAVTITTSMAIAQIVAPADFPENPTPAQSDADTGSILGDGTDGALTPDTDIIYIDDGFVDIDQPIPIDDGIMTIMPVTEEVNGGDVVIEDGNIPIDLILVDPIDDGMLTILPVTEEPSSPAISEEIIGGDVVIDDGNIPLDLILVDPIPNFDEIPNNLMWIQPDIGILPDDVSISIDEGEIPEDISGELPLVDDNLDIIIDDVPSEDIPPEDTLVDIIPEDGTVYPDVDFTIGGWFYTQIMPVDFEFGILPEDADPGLIDTGIIDDQTDFILVDDIVENSEYTDTQLGDPCVCELPTIELVGCPLFINDDFIMA